MAPRKAPPVGWPPRHMAVARLGLDPLHAQIAKLIRDDIDAGILKPGARLPAEKQLAELLGVSIAPVRQALLSLAGEGYLNRRQGDGTFVRAKVVEWISMLSGFGEAHAGELVSPELEVLSSRAERARGSMGEFEPAGSTVFALRRLARSHGTPVALLNAFLDPLRFPGIGKINFAGRSLYRTLAETYGTEITRAVNTLDLVHAGHDHARLRVASGSLLLRVISTTYAGEQAVEYAEILYRPDRFRFNFESVRTAPGVFNVPRPPLRDGANT